MNLIHANTKPLIPWKNGAGLTREIAVHFDEKRHENFLWRISMAMINEACHFSRFDGIDRTIAVLDGAGVLLKSSANPVTFELAQETTFSFSGEEDITAIPLRGTTTDLNVMTRRGFFEHQMAYFPFNKEMEFETNTEITFIIAKSHVIVNGQELHPFDSITGFKMGEEVELKASRKGEVFIIDLYAC